MKNWDPLSIFKYLTGGPTIHLAMFILLYRSHENFDLHGSDRDIYKDKEGKELFEYKKFLIHYMIVAHMACFIIHMLFEGGIYQFLCCGSKNKSLILPSVSRFLQIVLYQGLVFVEQDFLQYKLIPKVFPNGKNPKPEMGWFWQFDYFDMMIVMDFMSFVSVLVFVFIYLVSSLYPTSNIRTLMMLDTTETRSKDYLESQVYRRNLII